MFHDYEVTCMVLGIFGNRQLPYRGRIITDDSSPKIQECQHLVVAGGVCLKCRKKIPMAESKPLTFDQLRATVKANTKNNNVRGSNAMLNFWIQR